MKRAISLAAVAFLARCAVFAAPITLPIYIEDSHAGSFYWLAGHLDLDEPCTLLHFDAHSDASAIFDSDKLRAQLRRVHSLDERRHLLSAWREKGLVQCFDWIEPLMPSPIAQVIWIPRAVAEEEMEPGAIRQLDGHLEAAPRSAGSFRTRVRVVEVEELATTPIAGPVIASIDLDYFAGMAAEERAAAFERVWKFIIEQYDLRAITIAISRPYLSEADEANALLALALRSSLSLPAAAIRFEPFARVGHDRSLRAREYAAQGRQVPEFEVERSSPELRALLLANRERLTVSEDPARWANTLREWKKEGAEFHLAIRHEQPSTDGIWRIPVGQAAEIQVIGQPWYAPVERVRWSVERPQYLRCNLTARSDDEAAFARGAPPRPRWSEVELRTASATLPLEELSAFFDASNGCGAVRVKARITSGGTARETPAIEVRRLAGTGFRAALTEQFGLPYLFGSGALQDGQSSGPETGWGADCANFLVYALRRQGRRIPWSNPKQLRAYLETHRNNVSLGEAPDFSAADLESGLILHLGSHVAALMEDRLPLGRLDANDIVAHQLEGAPELISVGQLLRARHRESFDILGVPGRAEARSSRVLIGGDVMLGRGVGEQIKNGVDPFAGIRTLLNGTKDKIVNLECVASERGEAGRDRKFHLRAPLDGIKVLRAAGINIVGLANNHADDFGPEALRDSAEGLRAQGVAALAHEDVHYSSDGRFAVLALNDTGVTKIDRLKVDEGIAAARSNAECVIAFVHWGEENTAMVTERQRELARWLIEHGVDLVAGSHPHCLQPLDYYHGRPIVYSLGNLVFDGVPTLPSWSRGALLELRFGHESRSPALRLIPVELDRRGFPHLVHEARISER